jgi:diguanylate cyclase (GGDEF)-like protein/PAS domain S-box-containing protein
MRKSFFKQVISTLDSPLYITDPSGVILYANPAFTLVTGYEEKEVLGKKSSILKSGRMPQDYYERLWSRLLAKVSWKEEIINRRKDGTEYTALQYITPVCDRRDRILYFAALQYDLTREKELQNEKEIFFNVDIDLLCIVTEHGIIKQANSAWQYILGLDYEALEGRLFQEYVHEEDKESFFETQEKLIRENDLTQVDLRIRKSDEEYNWVSWRIYHDRKKKLFYASGRDVQERVEMEQKIREISNTDPLTGAGNRLKFDGELQKELIRAQRYQLPLAFMLCDIDHFKRINDTYGHYRGDVVLKRFVQIIQDSRRETDQLFRWGGEEFAILCPHTNTDDAVAFAERIRKLVEGEDFKTEQPVTVSIGVAVFRKDDTGDSLLRRADGALYEAKRTGRNRVLSSE